MESLALVLSFPRRRESRSMNNLIDKNILVTGGAGFVGGHLVEELVKLRANVIVVDIVFNKKSYLSHDRSIDKKCILVKQDICNYKKLLILIKKYKIEFIFHLAAQALVEDAYKKPKYTLINNVVSTVNILEVARLNPFIKGVVVASSDKCYGKLSAGKYTESDPLAGDHPYDTSKSATDLISTTYYKTYGIPVVVTRFGNIFGEGDLNFSRIIPGIMKALVENKQLEVRSDGKYIRDYLYVKDVVNAYLLLANNINKVKGEAFNFGSNETLSVIEVIKLVEKTLNKKISYKIINNVKNEIPYQSLDYTKIKKTLGWKPKKSIRSTVEKVLRWYERTL